MELRDEIIRFLKKHTPGVFRQTDRMWVLEVGRDMKIVYDGLLNHLFVITGQFEDEKIYLHDEEKLSRAHAMLLFYDYFVGEHYDEA